MKTFCACVDRRGRSKSFLIYQTSQHVANLILPECNVILQSCLSFTFHLSQDQSLSSYLPFKLSELFSEADEGFQLQAFFSC